MALVDIDAAGARQRLQEIAAANKAALDAHVSRAAELNAKAREAFEREEAALKAAEQRRAEADEKNEAAQLAAAQEQEPVEEAKPRPKTTLALGADEFKQEREARQAAEVKAPPPPVAEAPAVAEKPEKPADEPARSKTMRLGAPEDDEPAPARPARPRRPPRPEGDDDMSGRTWLR